MSKIVITQPMYLPWRGIFEQIRLADIVVFYDIVQLPRGTHNTFTTRVQIKTKDGWEWLSLPVKRSKQGTQLIKDTIFADNKWKNNHIARLTQAYQHSQYFEEVFETVVNPIYNFNTDNFSEFCINAIKEICRYLELCPNFQISSMLDIVETSDPNERVLNTCLYFDANEHIAGKGVKNYMDFSLFDHNNIQTKIMEYNLTPYPQQHGEFNPYVSILDLIFNVGTLSKNYLDSEAEYWKNIEELA